MPLEGSLGGGRAIGTATVRVVADVSGFRTALRGLGSGLSAIGRGLGSLIRAADLTGLARDAIKMGETYRIQMDNARASVVGLTHSQGEADDLMRRMTAFAIATPFDLPGVQNVTTRLLALGKGFGVTSGNVLDYVKVLGDTAAINGKGADSMLNVAQVMGKISGQGRVMTRDMNQITANFPSVHPWEILSDLTGKTEGDLRKLAAKPGGLSGIVDASTFINALALKMAAADGAAGAMDRRMQTLGGTIELFKDTMGVALADGLQPFFATLQTMMKDPAIQGALTNLIGGFSLLASTIMVGLAPALPGLVTGLTGIITALAPAAPILTLLVQMFAQLMAAVVPFITTIVNGLLPLLPALSMMFGQVVAAIIPLVGQIIDALLPVLPSLVQLFGEIVGAVVPLVSQLVTGLAPILPTLVTLFLQWVEALAPIVSAFLTGLLPVLPAVVDLISQIITVLGPIITLLITGLAPVLPIIAELFSALVAALGPFITQILTALLPVLPTLAQLLVGLVTALGPVLVDVVGLLAQLVPPLLDLIVALSPIIPLLGEALLGAMTALMPIVKPLIGLVTKFGAVLIKGLAAILPTIVQALELLGTALGPIIDAMGAQLMSVLQTLLPLLPPLAQLFLAIVQALIPLLPIITQLILLYVSLNEKLFSLLIPVLTKVIEVLTWLVDKLGEVLAVVGPFIEKIITWFQSLIDPVIGVIGKIIEKLTDFSGIWDAIKSVLDDIWHNVLEPIANFLTDVFGVAWEAIKLILMPLAIEIGLAVIAWELLYNNVLQPLGHFLADVFSKAWDLIKTGLGYVEKAIGFMSDAAKTVWHDVLEPIGNFLTSVFSTAWDAVKTAVDFVKDAFNTAKGAAKDVWDKLLDFYNWLNDKFEPVWNGIQSAVETMGSAIKKVAEGLAAPFKIAFNAIKDLWNNTIGGFGIHIPSIGPFGGADFTIPEMAMGGILTREGIFRGAERNRPEAVIPLTNPGRAMQLMQQSGLDRLAAQMGSSRGINGPLISMPNAVIQDATDADLVAQRTVIAMQAAMVA